MNGGACESPAIHQGIIGSTLTPYLILRRARYGRGGGGGGAGTALPRRWDGTAKSRPGDKTQPDHAGRTRPCPCHNTRLISDTPSNWSGPIAETSELRPPPPPPTLTLFPNYLQGRPFSPGLSFYIPILCLIVICRKLVGFKTSALKLSFIRIFKSGDFIRFGEIVYT